MGGLWASIARSEGLGSYRESVFAMVHVTVGSILILSEVSGFLEIRPVTGWPTESPFNVPPNAKVKGFHLTFSLSLQETTNGNQDRTCSTTVKTTQHKR